MWRTRTWSGVLIILIAALLNVGAMAARADGNNGTVKIHDTGTNAEDHRNEPHVCGFYLAFFNFDASQTGTWSIGGHGGTAGSGQASGSWGPADADGSWQSQPLTLSDGHYKLDVNTGQGDGKHKVFWVECGAGTTPSPTAAPAPTATPAPSATPSAQAETPFAGGVILPNAGDVPFAGMSAGSGGTPAGALAAEEAMPFGSLSGLPSTSTVDPQSLSVLALIAGGLLGLGGLRLHRRR